MTTPIALRAAHDNPAQDFTDRLSERTEGIFALPFFTSLSQGLTAEQWRLYAKQFHVTCVSFDRLLNAASETARKTNYAALIAELDENLADELGNNAPNKISHGVLRARFFRAIGLPETEMLRRGLANKIPVLPGTQKHTAMVEDIIEEGCVYTQVGAFMAQEYLAAGDGFWFLESGVRKSFPALADRNNEAMQYVYDHIECDTMEHFPHLLRATESFMVQPDKKRKIFAGAEAMLDAEWSLYDSFRLDLLGSR